MYKLIAIFSTLSLLSAACASSQNKKEIQKSDYPHLIELTEPENDRYAESKIYVDSVEHAYLDKESVLLIHGEFPDGCTYLREASHTLEDDQLELSLKSWRDRDEMCTQALEPFSFIFEDITADELENLDTLYVNDSPYPIH